MSKPIVDVTLKSLEGTSAKVRAVFDSGSYFSVLQESKLPPKTHVHKYAKSETPKTATVGGRLLVSGRTLLIIHIGAKRVSDEVLPRLGRDLLHRLSRPHLRYRLYRVASPYSSHVTIATVEGEDREGWLFSAGAACRERRDASWTKALLEAGHLMQNLCLLSATLDFCTLPLGGFFEGEVARELRLPRGDVVLYLGVCGRPTQHAPV